MNWFIIKIRARLYARGYRPKFGSIFYSPSLTLLYGFRDSGWPWSGVLNEG